MSRIIDAHHHFWQYTAEEYGWIDDSMAAVRRDYLAADLKLELTAAAVDSAISVHARQSLEETRWLLQIAAENDFIAGVVGWVPLVDEDVEAVLEEFSADPKLRGVRHVLEGERDEYMLTPEFQRGLAMLPRFGLVYDILVLERQLPSVIDLVDRNPSQLFVLDHAAKPLIREKLMEPWRSLIQQIAQRPNVYCKISGMAREDNWQTWSLASLRPYLDTVVEAFGPKRLMFGSDWPVCLIATSYRRWMETVREAVAALSAEEQSWIFGRTAEKAYGMNQ